MTNGPPKQRTRFQLHLSTCVVLMFIAAGLAWANLHAYEFWKVELSTGAGEVQSLARGWPAQHWVCLENDHANGEYIVLGIALNAAIALAFLAATAFTCEVFPRRRERKRAAMAKEPAP